MILNGQRVTGVNCAGTFVSCTTARRVLGHHSDTGATEESEKFFYGGVVLLLLGGAYVAWKALA